MTEWANLEAWGCGHVLIGENDRVAVHGAATKWCNDPATLAQLLTPGSLMYWETVARSLLETQHHAYDLALDLAGPKGPYSVLGFARKAGKETSMILVPYEERGKFHQAMRAAERQRAADQAEILRLEELDHMRMAFINDMSHQLATPMTPIRMQLARIKRATMETSDPIVEDAAKKLEASLNRLQRFHDALLDAARLQAGKAGQDMERVELAPLVDEIVTLWHQKSLGHVTIANLPKHVVAADRSAVRTCLEHLLDNAARFGPKDGSISIHMDADVPRLHVRDQGPGIPRHVADARRAFAKADAENSSVGVGSGLGLFVVNGLMEAQNGHLEFALAPSGGTDAVLAFQPWRKRAPRRPRMLAAQVTRVRP